jgi:hypothetical protein
MIRLSHAELQGWIAANRASLDRARPSNPFLGADWLQLHLEQAIAPTCLLALVDGPTGTAPWMADPDQPRRWRALGSYYASLYGALSGAARLTRPQDMAARRTALSGLQTVELAPLDAASADAWQGWFEAAGWWTRRFDAFGNWTLPCQGLRFDDYMAARPGQLKHTWARKRRRFETGAGGARLQMVTEPGEVDGAMDAYEKIYAKSWKPAESHPRFLRSWAARCAREGWLRLGLAWLGDVPIAAQFWFTLDGRANIFKLAYDEAHQSLSAGTVLSGQMFKHALDVDRVSEIDYLSGDDAYKSQWVDQRRQRVGLLLANPRTAVGLARGLRERLAAATGPWRHAASRWSFRPQNGA